MKKIVLNVEDKKFQTVMTILENLKEGLIEGIESPKQTKSRQASYQPNSGKIIDENQKPSGKYSSRADYKAKLRKAKS